MRLVEHLKTEGISMDLSCRSKEDMLRALAKLVSEADGSVSEDEVYEAFAERERLATTGVGSGVAIPHGRGAVEEFRLALGICPGGVEFEAVDGEPSRIFVAVLAPAGRPAGQLRMLAKISAVLRDDEVRRRLLQARNPAEALAILEESEGASRG